MGWLRKTILPTVIGALGLGGGVVGGDKIKDLLGPMAHMMTAHTHPEFAELRALVGNRIPPPTGEMCTAQVRVDQDLLDRYCK